MKPQIIGIPHGTRLQALVLCNGETHVWIACKQRGPDYSKWQGTYLRIESNGRITRVTVDDNYDVDDEFIIRPPDPVEYKSTEVKGPTFVQQLNDEQIREEGETK